MQAHKLVQAFCKSSNNLNKALNEEQDEYEFKLHDMVPRGQEIEKFGLVGVESQLDRQC